MNATNTVATRARLVLCFAVTVMIGLFASATVFADGVLIGRPMLSPSSPELEEYLDDQFMRAVAVASDALQLPVGYDGFATSVRVDSPEYTGSVIAVDVPESRSMILSLTGPGGTQQEVLMGGWGPNTYRDLATALTFVYVQLTGTSRRGDDLPARVLLDWNTSWLSTADLPNAMTLFPTNVRSRPTGTTLVAGNSVVVELDRYFREVEKHGVGVIDSYSWAYHLDVTPAGSIFAASGAQPGIYRLVPTLPRPQRLRTTGTLLAMAVLDDGTVFTANADQEFSRIEGTERTAVDLRVTPYDFIQLLRGGPDNTLWTWIVSTRRFVIFDSDGAVIDSMKPFADSQEIAGMRAFDVYPDGSVLVLTLSGLVKFDSDGFEQWRVTPEEEPELGSPQELLSLDFNPTTGLIHLSSTLSQRIVQLVDLAWVEQTRGLSDEDRALLAVSDRLRDNPDDSAALADRARFLEQQDAWEAAAYTWDLALSVDPFNSEAERALQAAEIRLLHRQARQALGRTMETLETLGVASAAEPYRTAQLLYEQLLARDPGNDEAESELRRLRDTYETSNADEQRRDPVTVTQIDLPSLFPSLMQRYAAVPAGSVTVRNPLDSPITNLTAEVQMRAGYIDFPRASQAIDELGPGETATLDLFVPLNRAVLALEEDLPVQALVTLRYRAAGTDEEVTEPTTVLLHRNTALTWDDTAKLAAFVMPNEETVRLFGLSTADPGPIVDAYGVSKRIFRAARIAEAVGQYGINYIEDPDSPFSEILGESGHVDTVRFPRETLRTRIGDCDDTTALMCSLYEAAGIPTAVMTSPGHVFLAFDTGEPEQNAWLFESDELVAITHHGTVWLPVESTILSEGFLAAWKEASRLVSTYEPAGQIEFIPIRDARANYPALSVEPASYTILPPAAEQLQDRFGNTVGDLVGVLYERSAGELAARTQSGSTRSRLRVINQLGILHARFGEPHLARERFEQAIDLDPDYTASYVNLANIEIMEQRPREAIAILEQPVVAERSSVLTNLLLAQAYAQLGDRGRAGEYLAAVEERAPQLAAQYATLAGPAAARASEAAETPVLPWATEEAD